MFVSTVIPTKNRPQLLKTALESVANQTYRDIEVIVIDEGSKVENMHLNEQLVAAFGPAFKYRHLPAHNPIGSGPSYTRNVGLAEATGDLVAFCDDDDFWCDRRHIETAVAAFESDPSLDMVFANQETRVDGKLQRALWLPSLVARLPPSSRSSDAVIAVARRDCLIDDHGHPNTCVFRRRLLAEIGGFWEQVRYLEDLDLFVRAVDRARAVGYRPQTVSVHNVPDRTKQVNASTQVGSEEKKVVQVAVANHLMLCCDSPEAHRFAGRLAGYTYRDLALQASTADRRELAFAFGRVALMWMPTWKWALYTVVLAARALIAGLGSGRRRSRESQDRQ
jgi:cellulose synthase/poly-beta-1,6-N-acetylglucosamine synthase-like glycosyltransferase